MKSVIPVRRTAVDTPTRRVIGYVVAVAALIGVYSVLYTRGMAAFEGRQITYWHAMQVVVESMTTVGYGSDAPWQSPVMNVFVSVIGLSGVVIVFTALPLLVVPLIQDALVTAAPTAIEDRTDHVVIAGTNPRTETLVEELSAWGVEYAFIEPDRERADAYHEDEFSVAHGDPESTASLRDVGIEDAQAIVADLGAEANASVVLAAREVAPEIPTYCLTEEQSHVSYLEYAGADEVFTPRGLLGEAIAAKVTSAVTANVDGIEVGEDFEIVELTIHSGSDLDGRSLAESQIGERTGAQVIGAWFQGEFDPSPTPATVLDDQTILLAAGTEAELEALRELTAAETRRHGRGEVVVAGHGTVGSTVRAALTQRDQPCTVVDREDGPLVDVLGDVTDESVLAEAGLADARAIVLALPDDTLTIFTTLVCSELYPDVEVVVRVEADESVQKLYRAGADYVLSLATVSGRMLASAILDEDVIALDRQVEVVRIEAGAFAGETLAGADIRHRTGCTVIAVERDGEVITDVGPAFELAAGDDVILAGTDDAVNRYTELATG
jgi:Trk K+ transport system NAD-binding subunit